MKLTFLGTGTSTGVPQLGCRCKTCTSTDMRDKRLRASVLIEVNGKNIIIDCGPDFYVQMRRNDQFACLNAALVTHIHYDHVGGVDDLRPFCPPEGFPFYCTEDVNINLHKHFPYCFVEHPYPGVPHFDLRTIRPYEPFHLFGTTITPLTVMHASLPIVGYKFGESLAYITDAKTIPQRTIDSLKGIDTLVLNALRIEPHHSHLSLSEALDIVAQISPRQAYFTHISHHLGTHAEVSKILPSGVSLAYDGLKLEL
ncbi:MAG: MBL fold metallo-hydrolase [Muribaculaceae bacterium]